MSSSDTPSAAANVVQAVMSGDYNANSAPQGAATVLARAFIKRVCEQNKSLSSLSSSATAASSSFVVADFGCSGGRNSLPALDAILEFARPSATQHVQLIMNDLPENNWRAVHQVVTEHFNDQHKLARVASELHADDKQDENVPEMTLLLSPVGFYHAASPPSSIDISMTATAVHWLSRKPCDIAHAYSTTSPNCSPQEHKIFIQAAAQDYRRLMAHRARELKRGGMMFLFNICKRPADGATHLDELYELLWRVAKGETFEVSSSSSSSVNPLLNASELTRYTDTSYIRTIGEMIEPSLLAELGLELLAHEFVLVESPLVRQHLLSSTQAGRESVFAKEQAAFYRSWTEHTLRGSLDTSRSQHDCDALVDTFYQRLELAIRANVDIWVRNPHRFYMFAALRKKTIDG